MFESAGVEDAPEEETDETDTPAEETAEGEEASGSDSFDSFADLALDSQLPMAERRKALKEAIMACMGTDYAEESEPGKDSSLLSSIFAKG